MTSTIPFWVQVLVSLLLVASGLLTLTGAVGLLHLKSFFQRLHPVALGMTLATWCACAASIAFFSALQSRPVVNALLIPILLCVTVPVTTILLARAALFRKRAAGEDVPPPLVQAAASPRRGPEASGDGASGDGNRSRAGDGTA